MDTIKNYPDIELRNIAETGNTPENNSIKEESIRIVKHKS